MDDYCLTHGYEHMKKRSIFDKIAYCSECEREQEKSRQWAADQARQFDRQNRGEDQ